MAWQIDVTWIEDWLLVLDKDSRAQFDAAMVILRGRGPALGRPLVDAIATSRHRNMKELRPGSSGQSELRVLFAFDPERRAILLLAGDKRGDWKQWYRRNIPIADNRFDEHLEKLRR